jgi:uncharacterized protein
MPPVREPSRAFYVLAFGITWGVGGLALLLNALGLARPLSPANPLYYVAGYGPTIAGLAVVGRRDGWPGIRRLLTRLIPSRRDLLWYPAVIVGFPALAIGVSMAAFTYTPRDVPWSHLPWLLAFTLVTDSGPLGEELGWRGVALPILLGRRSPLVAAVILGLIWGFWHLPTFFISTLTQSHLSFPVFLVNSTALSVLMTWLFARTDGDLSLMVVVHLMANFVAVPFNAEVTAEVIVATLIIVAGGLRAVPARHDEPVLTSLPPE